MEVSYRVNITLGRQEERMMLSGMHTVEDIFCCSCGQYLGWKYVSFPRDCEGSMRVKYEGGIYHGRNLDHTESAP